MATINKVLTEVRKENPRSAWGKGVKKYAIGVLEGVKEWRGGDYNLTLTNYKKEILMGAPNWKEYSWGGSAYVYDEQIAKVLSTKTELKKTKNGQLRPNAREEWLDVQARALYQADRMIGNAIRNADAVQRAKR